MKRRKLSTTKLKKPMKKKKQCKQIRKEIYHPGQYVAILDRMDFSGTPPNSKCIKWSPSNCIIGLNTGKCLKIFDINLNFVIKPNTVNKADMIRERLMFKPRCEIKSGGVRSAYQFNVGKLQKNSSRKSYVENLMVRPKSALLRIYDFEFLPVDTVKMLHLIAVLTDDYSLCLYWRKSVICWSLLHNLAQDLNCFYIANKWCQTLSRDIDYETCKQRLASVHITSFCFNSCLELVPDQKCIQYQLFAGMRNGSICCWKVCLSEDDQGNWKCCCTIEDLVEHTGLGEIVCIKHFDGIVLIESIDGQVLLYQCLQFKLTNRNQLWDEMSGICSYNFCINSIPLLDKPKSSSKNYEIVFHKVYSIIVVRLQLLRNGEFRITNCQTIPFNEKEEIFEIHNADNPSGRLKYYVTSRFCLNIYLMSTVNQGKSIVLQKIKLSKRRLNRRRSFFGFAMSTNQSMIALLSLNDYFCKENYHNVKNVTFYVTTCIKSLLVRRKIVDLLDNPCWQLGNKPRLWLDTVNYNDYLFLFRYYLNRFGKKMKPVLYHLLGKFGTIIKLARQKLYFSNKQNDQYRFYQFLKFVRFLLKRFLEVDNFTQKRFYDSSIRDRILFLLDLIDRLIFKQYFEQLLTNCDIVKLVECRKYQSMSLEQIISLYNIIQQKQERFKIRRSLLPELIQQNICLLAKKKNGPIQELKNCSTIADDDIREYCTEGQSLLDLYNRCWLCDEAICDPVTSQSCCSNHPIDVCANSLVIASPFYHSFKICVGCSESPLITPSIWPNYLMAPFDSQPTNICLYCL